MKKRVASLALAGAIFLTSFVQASAYDPYGLEGASASGEEVSIGYREDLPFFVRINIEGLESDKGLTYIEPRYRGKWLGEDEKYLVDIGKATIKLADRTFDIEGVFDYQEDGLTYKAFLIDREDLDPGLEGLAIVLGLKEDDLYDRSGNNYEKIEDKLGPDEDQDSEEDTKIDEELQGTWVNDKAADIIIGEDTISVGTSTVKVSKIEVLEEKDGLITYLFQLDQEGLGLGEGKEELVYSFDGDYLIDPSGRKYTRDLAGEEEPGSEDDFFSDLEDTGVFKEDPFTYQDGAYRLAGADRFESSAKISSSLLERQEAVILASGSSFPDALAGSNIVAGEYPILLTDKDVLPTSVRDEISRLGAKKAIILGGENSVSKELERDLADQVQVKRLAGPTRYETGLEIARIKDRDQAILVDGGNFPDALAASGLAYMEDDNILLNNPDGFENSLKDYLIENIHSLGLVGGEKSLPEGLVKRIEDMGLGYSGRISGANRFKTSVNIARKMPADSRLAVIASGTNYPDALAASLISQRYQAPILLVSPFAVDKSVVDFLVERQDTIDQLVVVGGENSVSSEVVDYLEKAIGDGQGHPGDFVRPILKEFPYRLLKQGIDHENVRVFKERLKAMGYYRGQVDTSFDPEAEIALRLYQYENDFPIEEALNEDVWESILLREGKVFDRSKKEVKSFFVPYSSQVESGCWVSCVPTSLFMALKNKGHGNNLSLRQFIENYLPRAKNGNPAEGFPGSPYQRSNYYQPSIWPNVQVKMAEKIGGRASDLTGVPLYALQDELYMGNAVTIIGTLYWARPNWQVYMVDGQPRELIYNLHGFVLAGYNPNNDTYMVTDPYNNTNDRWMLAHGARYGQRFDFWEKASVIETTYGYMEQATSVWK